MSIIKILRSLSPTRFPPVKVIQTVVGLEAFIKVVVHFTLLVARIIGHSAPLIGLVVQEVAVAVHLGAGCHREKRFLALVNFFALYVVLNEHFLELAFQKSEPVDFSLKVIS